MARTSSSGASSRAPRPTSETRAARALGHVMRPPKLLLSYVVVVIVSSSSSCIVVLCRRRRVSSSCVVVVGGVGRPCASNDTNESKDESNGTTSPPRSRLDLGSGKVWRGVARQRARGPRRARAARGRRRRRNAPPPPQRRPPDHRDHRRRRCGGLAEHGRRLRPQGPAVDDRRDQQDVRCQPPASHPPVFLGATARRATRRLSRLAHPARDRSSLEVPFALLRARRSTATLTRRRLVPVGLDRREWAARPTPVSDARRSI